MSHPIRNKGAIAVLISVGVILVVAAGVRLSRPSPALPAPGAPPVPAASPAPTCASTADCGAGFRCVVPGVCSRVCNVDGDCPAGRRCAELRVLEGAEAPGEGTPAVATTCVVARPG